MRIRSIGRWMIGLALFGLVVGALSGCIRPDLRPIGAFEIYQHADELIETAYEHRRQSVIVQRIGNAAPAQWANDRLPTWAKADYDACVYWRATYNVNQNWQKIASGVIRGWVAVDYEMNVHILEINFVEDDTGRSGILLDGWADPSPAPGGS